MSDTIDLDIEIDPRVKLLSYSSIDTLNRCDREFQLYRMSAKSADPTQQDEITFAFGHLVGAGICMAVRGMEENDIILELFFKWWKPDLLAENERQKKSFFYGIYAVQKFCALYRMGAILKEYEIVEVTDDNGDKIPAVELACKINFPDGFQYRLYMDMVLRHRETGEILVLENKTTSLSPVQPAIYKNSDQGLGYAVVLDTIFPELSSYKVLYLVYDTKAMEFEPLPFIKTHGMRALWIQSTLNRIDRIKTNERSIYPMNGSSCLRFFKECPYYQTCTLSTSLLATNTIQEVLDEEKEKVYNFTIDLKDIILSQIEE